MKLIASVACVAVAAPALSALGQLEITAKAQIRSAAYAMGMTVLDADGDGLMDPVIAYRSGLITHYNDLGLRFISQEFYNSGLPDERFITSIASGPLDSGPGRAGGQDDLLLGLSNSTAIVLLNSNGPRQPFDRWVQNNQTSDSTNPLATNVAIQFFDDPPSPVPSAAVARQTKPTLLATSASTKKSTSRTGDGSGGFPGTDSEQLMSDAPGQMAFADFTGDGKLDMAVLIPATGTIELNKFVRTLCCPNPSGKPNPEGVEWLPLPSLTLGARARCIAATDVNGDGKSDLLVGLDRLGFLHTRVRILLGNGDGTFSVSGPDIEMTDAEGDLTNLLPVVWNVGSSANARPDAIITATSNAHQLSVVGIGSVPTASQWIEGSVADMSDDGTTIAGNPTNGSAWLWKAPATHISLPVPPGYSKLLAKRISGDGSTVVGEATAIGTGAFRAFRWTAAQGTTFLPDVPGFEGSQSRATTVSFDGTRVAGTVNPQLGFFYPPAFIWTPAAGSRLIRDVLADAGISDTTILEPQDMSDDGFVLVCAGPPPDVVNLPGGSVPADESIIRGNPFTPNFYGARLTRDGTEAFGTGSDNTFYHPVIWRAPIDPRLGGLSTFVWEQGDYVFDGFNRFRWTGATLNDVGNSLSVWCGSRSFKPWPSRPSAEGVSISKWAAITPTGSVLAGTGSGTVGGISGSWPLRSVNFATALLTKFLGASRARGVSRDGEVVVGRSIAPSGTGTVATRWSRSTGLENIGDLPGGPVTAEASASSADGSVVVGESDSAPGREAFRWTAAGGMVGLGDLPGGVFNSVARGCSGDGNVIVGQSSSAQGLQAYKWTPTGGMVGIGFLNNTYRESNAGGVSRDGKVVVGTSRVNSNPNHYHAFRQVGNRPPESLGTIDPNANFSAANATNADGSVVVGQSKYGDSQYAFRWTRAGMTYSGWSNSSGPTENYAGAVSDDGSIVVGAGRIGSDMRAWVWDASRGYLWNLNDLFPDSGWTFIGADGVSADGTVITGRGINPAGLEDGFVIRWRPSGQRSYVEPLLPTGDSLSLAVDEPILVPNGVNGIVTADFDNDARQDIATISDLGDLVIYGTSMSTPCRADYNGDAFLTFEDFDDFVADFSAGLPAAELNGDGFLTFEDFDNFVGEFEAGC